MATILRKPFGVVAFLAILVSGCSSQANTKDPETMYDIASELKDISTAVQGLVKYSDASNLSEPDILLEAVDNDSTRLEIFADYKLRVRVDDQRSSVLLCDDDVALIEDTGCTPEVDLHHWNSGAANQCHFTIDLADLCH